MMCHKLVTEEAFAESHLPGPDSLLPCPPRCLHPARHRSTPSLHPLSCAGGHSSLGLSSPGHTASTLHVNDIIHSFFNTTCMHDESVRF